MCVCVCGIYTKYIIAYNLPIYCSYVTMLISFLLNVYPVDYSGSTEEEDKRLGFVAPVLFFILALQTGLSSLHPEERLVCDCLYQQITLKNFCGCMLNFICSLAPI